MPIRRKFDLNSNLASMKKLIFSLLMLLLAFSLRAQEETSSKNDIGLDLRIDMVSRYLWRGLLLDNNPCIQPDLSVSMGNFTIGSWASYGYNSNFPEIDLYLTYELGLLSFTIFDYYNEDETDLPSIKYFTWDREITSHALEGTIAWNGTESFPLRALAATFFYGNDRDTDGKQYYSTYFELGYPFSLNDYSLELFLGATPAKGLYNNTANVVNIGITASKEIKFTENFTLPIKGSFVVNPAQENVFFVVGITLQ